MSTSKFDFGMIGLGVMGRNFLLNVADNNFSALGLDLDEEKVNALKAEGAAHQIDATTSMEEFVEKLSTPRKIMLLVPAGKAVDAVIGQLLPLISEGDLIIDGGNSHFDDTNRRSTELEAKNINFLGVGVSGGAEGARRGPSIMPGGNPEAYQIVAPILEAVSAKVNGDPCVDYMGKGAAGHYVKMVHNGIEYSLMQLIAEIYDILHRVVKLSNAQIADTFKEWNEGELRSYLVEITADIFTKADEEGDGELIDKILDKAKQKGTGKWTSQSAMDLGVPIPAIDAAVSMRGISALKVERLNAFNLYAMDKLEVSGIDTDDLVNQLKDTLYFGFLIAYAQGYTQLAEADKEMDLDLNMERTAKIWRGGCIIRADLLETIRKSFDEDAALTNLVNAPAFKSALQKTESSIRSILKLAMDNKIPTMALSACLTYFDAYRTARLPLNLVQAQRDYFGAHTYERIDKGGTFHTEWKK
ncbi:MAG: NADP-dependent phosphogluconate dehydrogenase [Bacteroidota bacterium]